MGQGKFEKKNRKAASQMKAETSETDNTRKNKKNKLLLRIAIVVLAVLLVVLIVLAVAMNYVFGKIGRYDETEPSNSEPVVENFETENTEEDFTGETVDPEDVEFDEVELLGNKNVVNILLVGNDTRYEWEDGRADTIILVSLNKKKNSVQLTSFMRDLYVQIPGYLDNKINASFRFGGIELLNQTLEKNFGIVVDGNVEVNFDSFVEVVDILGGVDVELDWEEKNYMYVSHGYVLPEGKNHLGGYQALCYARMRHVSGGDFSRSERQREVITSVIESLKESDLSTVLELIDKVLPYVTTDLTDAEIINYATVGLSVLAGGAEITSLRIPADDAHYATMISEMSVLVPDLAMCQEDLKEFIYSDGE